MIRNTVLAAFLSLLVISPALANQCPVDLEVIDQALQTTELSGAELEQVTALRDQGKSEHEAGDHSAAVATLAEAKMLLGIEE